MRTMFVDEETNEGEYYDDDEGEEADDYGDDTVAHDQTIEYAVEPPEEGIYGMAIASALIDTRKVMSPYATTQEKARHGCRFLLVMFLVFFTLGLQCFITVETKLVITPEEVVAVRKAYGKYEDVMYDGHTTLTAYGHKRGIPGFFNVTRFDKVSKDDQHYLCELGMTRPVFLFTILLLWSMTNLRYLRKNVAFTHRILVIPCNVSSITDAAVFVKVDGNREVANITCFLKFFMIAFIQVPVLLMNVLLLWIGCRWLVATVGFSDLLLNAIALEFVLVIHELVYFTSVPQSMKNDLNGLMFSHSSRTEKPGWANMLGTFSVLILAIVWVFVYIRFQQVLPDYRWDVSEACNYALTQDTAAEAAKLVKRRAGLR